MLLIVGLIVAATSGFAVLGRFLLTRSAGRSVDRLRQSVDADIEQRLRSIPEAHNGSIVEGPALETLYGKLALYPSKAPESFVVDTAKFTAPVPGDPQVTVVRVEDSKKVMGAKGQKPVTPEDPDISRTHLILAANPELGRRLAEAAFIEKLRALDRGVKGRCRLSVVRGTATVLLARGLAKPEELKAFYDGSLDVIAALRERLT